MFINFDNFTIGFGIAFTIFNKAHKEETLDKQLLSIGSEVNLSNKK